MTHKILLFIGCVLLSFSACKKDKDPSENMKYPTREERLLAIENMMQESLRECIFTYEPAVQRLNPYSIAILREVADSLLSWGVTDKSITDMALGKTLPQKKYVRFAPTNAEEIALLQGDTTLMLFDFPLDYNS